MLSFPPHIEAVLDAWSVRPETKAALLDLYLSAGNPVLEAFSELTDERDVSELTPGDVAPLLRTAAVEFVRRCHPRWGEGVATESFWRPRSLGGRAAGTLVPLGRFAPGDGRTGGEAYRHAAAIAGSGQPLAPAILLLGRTAHSAGRLDAISFDVVPESLEEAVAIAASEGRHHTAPGSVGQTSATFDAVASRALIGEIQPNVYKPGAGRNRPVAAIFRRHRNWHIATLAAALVWLRESGASIAAIRGSALAATHEVDRSEPLSPRVAELYDRTVVSVVGQLGGSLTDATDDDAALLAASELMNEGLASHIGQHGPGGAISRIEWTAPEE
jgi:hypothetical protein